MLAGFLLTFSLDLDPSAVDQRVQRTLRTPVRHVLSQAALAQRAGCSRPTIIALERNLSGNLSILLSVLVALGLRRVLRVLDMPGPAGLVPMTNAPVRDLVMTPAPLAAAVIAHFTEQIAGSILDPARGQGAFFDQFPSRLQRCWCEVTEGRDFLKWDESADWIATNPPWSRLRDFTRHAMTLAQNIVWLARAHRRKISFILARGSMPI